MIITIDGPSGVGKNTVCGILAEKLDLTYINSGSLFRSVAYIALQQGYTPDNDTIEAFLEHFRIHLKKVDHTLHVLYQDQDITNHLYTPDIATKAAEMSLFTRVRLFVHKKLREIAQEYDIIADGRDAGSHIFPFADYKFYIDAAPEIRAHRRFLELLQKGVRITEEEALQQTLSRDALDSNKGEFSLKKHPDQHIIDTEDKPAYDVAMEILTYISPLHHE